MAQLGDGQSAGVDSGAVAICLHVRFLTARTRSGQHLVSRQLAPMEVGKPRLAERRAPEDLLAARVDAGRRRSGARRRPVGVEPAGPIALRGLVGPWLCLNRRCEDPDV